ncbi:MAG: sulfide/dihydroorotate dehydrogenase-like FAD/NAD-binding protein [Oscillospiraceae bacterium]|nr:sulfide/dihydroorotate dehydrogenase-like FAD/NAD-binding protein [Oscillospiraceae bacterium]
MYKIVNKRQLNATVTMLEIEAPLVARKAQPGQFIIFRIDEFGERVPLTIAAHDKEKGTVTIIFNNVGKSTKMLGQMEVGDALADFVGPLGVPTEMEGLKKVLIVGGGTGNALAYPIANGMHKAGIEVDMIAGYRTKEIVILEDELKNSCTNLYLMTDDGTYGEKGFTTVKLKELLDTGKDYDAVVAVGPPMMMKFVCEATKPYNIKTIASLTAIMIDGTGMCGGCRITVGGERKFVCVDGPEFDGHLVDWDELIKRGTFYRDQEQEANKHVCRITGGVRQHG